MDNKIIEMKKENKLKTWVVDHTDQLIIATEAICILGCMIFLAKTCKHESNNIDEWVPAPYRTTDGKVGITMMGLKHTADGGALMLDHKDYTYEKLEYARNIANNILDMANDAEKQSE